MVRLICTGYPKTEELPDSFASISVVDGGNPDIVYDHVSIYKNDLPSVLDAMVQAFGLLTVMEAMPKQAPKQLTSLQSSLPMHGEYIMVTPKPKDGPRPLPTQEKTQVEFEYTLDEPTDLHKCIKPSCPCELPTADECAAMIAPKGWTLSVGNMMVSDANAVDNPEASPMSQQMHYNQGDADCHVTIPNTSDFLQVTCLACLLARKINGLPREEANKIIDETLHIPTRQKTWRDRPSLL